MEKVNTKGTGKLFENKILEALTRTHPAIIVSMYVPAGLFALWYHYHNYSHSILATIGIFLGGFFVWTFAEYLLHRYIFHFVNESEWSKKFHYYAHGIHHAYPKDKERLIMPPLPSIIIAALFFGVFYLIMRNAAYAFLPGFVYGYLAYALTHYAIHAIKPPKGFTYVWKHHNLHHFKYPDKAFGVSSPLWDHVFGTMPPRKDRKSAKA